MLYWIKSVSCETKPMRKDVLFTVEYNVRVWEAWLKDDRVICEKPVHGWYIIIICDGVWEKGPISHLRFFDFMIHIPVCLS